MNEEHQAGQTPQSELIERARREMRDGWIMRMDNPNFPESSSHGDLSTRMADEWDSAEMRAYYNAKVAMHLQAENERLREALVCARFYVKQAVDDDGGIDSCEIEYRMDLERIDAALGDRHE